MDMKKTIFAVFCCEGGKTLAQVTQSGGGCPIPWNIPGQVGQDSEQADQVTDVLQTAGALELMVFNKFFPIQSIL